MADTPRELLAELNRRGIRLWAEEGRLRYDAPAGVLDDALRATLAEKRAALLAVLAGPAQVGARASPPPLSFGQLRLWFLHQLAPEDRAYNVPATVRLQGDLDPATLARAIDEIVRRHETLRSRFPAVDGRATLVVEPPAPRPLAVEELPAVPEDERLAEATRLARQDALRTFDLAAGPLFRARLFRVGPRDHVLHVVMHHIVSDGWSMGNFFKELAALYGAFLRGEPSPLPELPLQYADWARRQREQLEQRGLAGDLAWWTERLGGELPTLDLPTDRPRRAETKHRGAYDWFPLDSALLAGIGRVAQREGATRFHVLLSAFLVLLARHTGQEDVVIGTPTAGRSRREIEGLIGFFVNNLVLRGDLSGDPSFRELLRRVRTMVVETFAHQDTPFERLVEALVPERELGRNPLFQVLFNHFVVDERLFALPPLELSTIDMTLDVSKFDLTLHCFEAEGQLVAKLEYDTDLFDAETVRSFGERYVTLLRGIVADPARPISRLPILGDAERRRLLVEWNRTEAEPPHAASIHALFEAQAARTPHAPALVFEDERLSYAELDRRATALARRLLARGIGPEVRVALFLDRSAELIVALLGVLKAGGAYVPIDVSTPAERVSFVLADSDCRLLLTRSKLLAHVPEHGAEVLCLDAEVDAGDAIAPDAPLPAARPGQLAYVIYTSGSTGRPKGVEVEHAHLLDYLAGIQPRLDVPADSSYASVSTLAADLGNTSIFPALCGGGCLHLLSEERIGDSDAFGDYMRKHAVDVLKIVPSHLEALLAAAARPADLLPRRLLVVGGEACTWELVEHVQALAPHCAVLNHYGPAETTVGKLTHRIMPDDRQRFPEGPPLGRPLPNARIYLVDARREPVPVGAVGELLIGGRGVTRGYRNQPELTAARFIPDPFRRGAEGRVYCTGDLARFTRDGQLLFVGRNDEQVKLRGYRVELGEVRSCLERHDDVATSAVVVRKDPLGVQRLAAYVVPKAGRQPEPADLRAFVKLQLPDYMVPASFVLLDALPLTPNGKLDRAALPEAGFDRESVQGDYVPPRTPAEKILARIWCDVLRLERVGVHDNFFELGGESILSIQIISRANQAGLRLKPRDVFERATIAGLAAVAGTVQLHRAEQGPVTGPVPLTPIQHRFFGHEVAEPWHYNHAMLLALQRPVDAAHLDRALLAIENHHDVLRLRFTRTEAGWAQALAAPVERNPLEVHDLANLPPGGAAAAIESLAALAQAGLDLERGPLWRALLFRLAPGAQDRLLLVIHHLAVDGVSWRLLLEDLVTSYGQLEQGRVVELPPKTTSFQRWAERLVERAREESTLREAGAWLTEAHRHAAPLPVDRAPDADANLARDADTLQVSLDEAETTLLLREVPRAFHTQINDVLLTALVRACAPWTGAPRLLVELEGHGREDLFEDVDTSRTVGWFTSVHPVVFDTGEARDPGEALCLVKEQLRAIPGRGLGWGLLRWLAPAGGAADELRALPAAQVGFNYMGHFDQSLQDGALFRRAPESPGPATSLANRRRYLLDVGGSISGGRLHVSWTFARRVHERATVEALAARFLVALRELIRHCTAPGVGGSTPSDFPLARLDAAELATLEARYGRTGIEDIYVMSPLQRGMVFHSLAEPGSPTYITQLALTLHGELSPPDFQAAWQAALDANPILRTALVVQGLREMHQVVCRRLELNWTSDDWSALPEDELQARLAAQARADREQGFELADAPLMRLKLIRIGEDRHRFLWTHHHALLDGWSLPLLIRDVFMAYQSRGAQALPPRRPFSEYIRWVACQDEVKELEHWRALLAGWSEPTPLPAGDVLDDGGGADRASGGRAILGEELSQRATAALGTLARRHHITLNTLVQGAWALLLSRHSGSEDVLFGVTVSGRPPDLPGVETMLGLFINTLPLRVKTADAPLLPWLADVQAQLMELQQLQASPLYEVQRLAAGRGSAPLFESLVVFENYPVALSEPIRTSGLRIEDAVDVSHATYPLALIVAPRQRLHLELRYDTKRFSAGSIHRLLQHLRTLLEGMAARPESTLSRLPMLGADELRAELLDWNATDVELPGSGVVHHLIEEQARQRSDTTAVVFHDESLTYADLNARANQVARALRALGARRDVLVGLCVRRGTDMLVGLLGILKSGAAYLPLDPAYPAARLAFMLQDAGVELLVTQEGLLAGLPAHRAQVLCLDRDRSTLDAQSPDDPDYGTEPDDLAYAIYTSGSTGTPKAALLRHRGLCNVSHEQARTFGVGPGTRVLQFSSLSFDASTFEVVMALPKGATLFLGEREELLPGPSLLDFLRRHAIELVTLTPSALAALPVAELPALRTITIAGEACSADLVQRWAPGRRFFNLYGPTEATIWSTMAELRPGDVPTIGRPIGNTQVLLFDGHLNPVPVGAPGEIHIGGTGLARGYLNRDALTAERFIAHPFRPGERLYRTGDLGRRLPDGRIEYVGRIDHQVKLRGFRIELGEIEAALRRQPGIRDAVVLCREDETGDKQLVAYVVATEDAAPDIRAPRDAASMDPAPGRDALRAALAAELPDYMVPAAFVFLAALPLNLNGKVDRQALPSPSGRQTSRAFTPPHTETEQRIAAIWREVLGVELVGRRDNFFDLGGHSLKLLAVHTRLVAELGASLSITDLFQHTTVEALALYLDDARGPGARAEGQRALRREADARTARRASQHDGAIAVIGMAGRFPRAPDVETFWRNLCDGVESVSFFTDEELAAAGVPAELIRHPRYVKARAILQDPDRFDAQFFGYTPREAELMDPQQRLLLECAWEVCERAACDPERYPGLIGVFAGASMNSYSENLRTVPDVLAAAGGMAALIGGLNDFLATRVSYKLNLRGPSVNVQTACSTSLVAVHEACMSLLAGRCDMALAGGVSVTVPWTSGYLYEESGIRSSDGHCRTFDARAQGIVSGNAVALVALKRLADALTDGDTIHAVIRGSATNNDGSRKVGYTAPSIEGQAEVIAQAQAAAGVQPDSIGYVECHGTATALGDPVEVAALARAFREGTAERGFCALASLKSNMGHLDAAAGVAGLIKAALAVKHGRIPPSLHYTSPNPEIDFAESPFFVNTECRNWAGADGAPRRAGVSSFGIGGTNAHAVLEEPPRLPESGASREWQLLQLSARTATALEAMTSRLAAHLQANPGLSLADVAHTLRVGRREFEHRRAVVCRDINDAVETLAGRNPERRFTGQAPEVAPPVVFLFPGHGGQYIGMARQLYDREPTFRRALDECIGLLKESLDIDLRSVIFPESADPAATERLMSLSMGQPALFAIEYSLAQLWMSWGIKPVATIGHSTGEFTSACLAGVLELPDAIRLVALRGRLMESMPQGVMLAVPLAEDDVGRRIAGRDGLWLAGVNAPAMCVVGGTHRATEALEKELVDEGLEVTRVHAFHAAHSGLMADAVPPFVEAMSKVRLSAPRQPYVSTLTGDWITPEQATDPDVWGRHIRETIRYSAGITRLLEDESRVLLELGPGSVLGSLARMHPACKPSRVVLTSLRHSRGVEDDGAVLLGALGRLWTAGVAFDAARFSEGERRRRLELPTYPFERSRHWIERREQARVSARQAPDDWFYVPVWRPTRAPSWTREGKPTRCLVFGDGDRLERRLEEQLSAAGCSCIVVRTGPEFSCQGERCTMDPASLDHARQLVRRLAAEPGGFPESILSLWNAHEGDDREAQTSRGFVHLRNIVRALSEEEVLSTVRMSVLTSGVHTVTGDEHVQPERAMVLGICRVASLELPNLSCRQIDLGDPGGDDGVLKHVSVEQLAGELLSPSGEPVVAWREGRRFAESFAPVPVRQPEGMPVLLREGGTYLVTGGLGGVGLASARALHQSARAKLVLVGRTPLPERSHWAAYLETHGHGGPVAQRIRGLRALEESGAEVLVLTGDVSSASSVAAIVEVARKRFGRIDGVIHAAGIPPGGLILRQDLAKASGVLAPKVAGTRRLIEALGEDLDFVVLCSSLNAVKGFPGSSDHGAANAFLDAFARSLDGRAGPKVISVAWNRWRESGQAVAAAGGRLAVDQGISDAEGAEVLRRVLDGNPGAHVLISEFDLHGVLRPARAETGAAVKEAPEVSAAAVAGPAAAHSRPKVAAEFVAPSTDLELRLAAIWEELMGIHPVGVHDNFFELGGHSLLAMRVLNRLSQEPGGLKLSLRAMFETPTIAGLAGRLASTTHGAGRIERVPSPKTGTQDDVTTQALDDLDPDAVASLSDDAVATLLQRLSTETTARREPGAAGPDGTGGNSR